MWQNQSKAFIAILQPFEKSIQKKHSVEDPSPCSCSGTLHSKNELTGKKKMKEAHRVTKINATESRASASKHQISVALVLEFPESYLGQESGPWRSKPGRTKKVRVINSLLGRNLKQTLAVCGMTGIKISCSN